MPSEYESILRDFGHALGLEGVGFDDNGQCVLTFDEVVVHMEPTDEGNSLSLFSEVGELPVGSREELYHLLLEANFFCRGTGGGTLGVDARSGSICLFRRLGRGTDAITLEHVMADFVSAAEFWTGTIRQMAARTQQGNRASPLPDTGLRV